MVAFWTFVVLDIFFLYEGFKYDALMIPDDDDEY